MSNVIESGIVTRLPIPVKKVLDNTPRDLQSVVICGYDVDGDFYFASSEANGAEVIWLLEMAKKKLLEIGDCCDSN